jgi:hypothetical protein
MHHALALQQGRISILAFQFQLPDKAQRALDCDLRLVIESGVRHGLNANANGT